MEPHPSLLANSIENYPFSLEKIFAQRLLDGNSIEKSNPIYGTE
jgi:hypothetical protein